MAGSQDTEITLGVGKMLGLFLSLVVLCALSMGTGYWIGRNSAKQEAAAAAPTATASPAPVCAGNKPGAAQPAAQPKEPQSAGAPAASPSNTSTPNPSDLTFYQAVQQKDSHPQLAPLAAASGAASSAAPAGDARSTLGTGYLVQIAAVRYQDDARLLSETLRKQQYPVVISQPGDNLFHVQVGPYADVKEAEAIRARLVSAGYNPFLKH